MNSEFKGIHHGFIGIVLMFVGFILVFISPAVGTIAVVLGLWIFMDDFLFHGFGYESFIHGLYIKYLYRFEWVKRVNIWFDKLFGKNIDERNGE